MQPRGRVGSTVGLLAVALAGGVIVATSTASFIWAYDSLIELLWSDLPGELGVDPFRSWYLFAVPAVGGVLVGLGQMLLGNYPRPLGETVERWRSGDTVDQSTVPATTINSLSALGAGGPVGFEAALTGLIGGLATWISRRVGRAASLVRQAWGAERVDTHHGFVTTLPYWVAALSGLLVYRWLPFGHFELTFRFDDFDGRVGVVDALVIFGFSVVIAFPAAWAFSVVGRAEAATLFQRSPIVAAVAGGLGFAAMAWVSPVVLFSGQQDMQRLVMLDNAELAYVGVAKWAALVVALLAGWRGGPVFPMFTAVAAIAVLADELFEIGPNLIMVGGIATISVVLTRGSIVVAFILTLYAVPISFSGVILIGCLGGAVALAVAGSIGWLPPAERHGGPPPDDLTRSPTEL